MTAGKPKYRNTLLAALIVLPLLLLSVFPQGTMAVRGADGIEVVLCTGDGPLTILVDENGTPIDDQHADVAGCDWVLLGQSIVLASALETSCAAPIVAERITGIDEGSTDLPSPHRTHAARAPPVV